jgi:3-oxoadipate enol-lactonase
MTADIVTIHMPATRATHELVLLHGQPGSPADWAPLAVRLPAQFHAVAANRPGYGSSRLAAGGFAANARGLLADLDSRGVKRAVLVGHSYGGGVALSAASLAPERVAAVVLLASVGPGCVNGWDRLLAAPGAGQLCALVAWRLTPWIARARLARIRRRRGRLIRPDEHVNWQVWAGTDREYRPLWRTFLTEQRALLRELGELESAIPAVQAPVLLLADPDDTQVPVGRPGNPSSPIAQAVDGSAKVIITAFDQVLGDPGGPQPALAAGGSQQCEALSRATPGHWDAGLSLCSVG